MQKLTGSFLIIITLAVLFFFPLLISPRQIAGNFGDIYQHYYPLKHFCTEQLITGELPLWNPYIFAGQPLQANPQSAVFYPLSLLFALFPLVPAFNYFFVIHFIGAGLFFYLFVCGEGLRPSAALFGSVAFMFSSFLVYKVPAGHPAALSGYIWLPLILLMARAFLRKPDMHVPSVLLFAGVMSFVFLSGHTFPWYLAMTAVILCAAAAGFRAWKPLLAAGGCFIGFSALQLLPTLELSRMTETANWPELVRHYSLQARDLLTAVLPNSGGNVIDGSYRAVSSYFLERNILYSGIIPLLLGLAGILQSIRNRQLLFPVLWATGLVLAFGPQNPLYAALYPHLPGLSYLRVPARFAFLSITALLAGAAFFWNRHIVKLPPWIKGGLLLVVVADLFAWNGRFISAQPITAYRQPSSLASQINPAYRVITDPASLAANRAMLHHFYNLNGYEAILLTDFVRYLGLQERQSFSATGLARTRYDSPLARGFSVGATVSRPASAAAAVIQRVDNPLPRAYFAASAHVIPDRDVYDQIAWLRASTEPPDRKLLLATLPENVVIGANAGADTVLSVALSPRRCIVEAAAPVAGVLVLSEMAYPGWKAYTDGRELPVQRAHKVFRSLVLPPGLYTAENRIFFFFHPAAWVAGMTMTLVSLCAAIGYCLYRTARCRLPAACQQAAR